MKKFYIILLIVIVFAVAFFSLNVLQTHAPGVVVDSGIVDRSGDTYTDTNTNTNSGSGRVRAPEDVTLKVGESKLVMGELTLALQSIDNDYRCPSDVTCIQTGAVNLTVVASTFDQTATINHTSNAGSFIFEGYAVSVVSITPEAYSGKTISQQAYEVTLHIESALTDPNVLATENDLLGRACVEQGGIWDGVHSECLGVSANACTEIGGSWNECASACRHDPTAEVCTMQCVLVCQFK